MVQKSASKAAPTASTSSTRADRPAMAMDDVIVRAKACLQENHKVREGSILDEIDAVLEKNAEEFVRNYVQKGGQ